ncbi:glycosyltransferase family 4 protein [Halorarius litoreus]|uniref:glycosyltransferase family 4 protein n=1 Tax=Halorarius litoreus TaxID=2962676 RepID=UPI0020CFB25F|nr:glycosyltransferase family 4 protein [Halorarius litoreus]
MTERLDVGFVPAECPGANATGATHTSTLLVERLSRHHDLTVYVSSQMDASERDLPARDRVEYVLHDDLPKLPHPISVKVDALRKETTALESHDLVHSYSPAFLPVLAELAVPTLVTLNSYVPVCPKGDMMYQGKRKCSGPSPAKCAGCVASTSLSRRQGVEDELRAAYTSLGRLGFVSSNLDRADDIDAYHALSPHLVDDYAELGFPGDRTTVVPHFYDEAFRRDPDDGPADGALSLLYVGALQDIKGVDVLVRALPNLAAVGVDVDLRIAGTGPLERQLRRLATDLGVDDAITWLGYVDHADLPAEYERADAFVYPGRLDEPFGRVLLEALASGTPVVASDVGSTDYIVGDAGVRFESEDSGALADACLDLVDDYRAYADAIPAQLEQFAPETVVTEFCSLYASVADRRPTAPPVAGAAVDD